MGRCCNDSGMSTTRARPIVITAVTASALLLVVAMYVESWWRLAAGVAAIVANVILAVRFEDSRKAASAGAILAALACAIPPFLA